eukprot:m.20529 g.20529  ORF g.20529 m.20529 type:complete len:463 (+) comp10576_c0_seq1:163-1551(+)
MASGPAEELERIGCCKACIQRFTGERQASSSKDRKLDGAAEEPVCVACEGVFQVNWDAEVKRISDAVQSSGYEYSSFVLSVSVPFSFAVRQHAVLLHMKDTFPACRGWGDIMQVKDAVKDQLLNPLVQELKVPCDVKSPFHINLTIEHEESSQEHLFLAEADPSAFRTRKGRTENFGVASVATCLQSCPDHRFKRLGHCPPKLLSTRCPPAAVSCFRESIYLAGRYTKYSRELSQTPWLIDGERKCDDSVQELLTKHIEAFIGNKDIKFSSSGREDCDVRMLGRGRPFIAELVDPRLQPSSLTPAVLRRLQEETNSQTSQVGLRDLQLISREETQNLQEGAEDKTKTYSCLVWLSRDVSDDELHTALDSKKLVLKQKTPIRVMHRRSLAVRERTVFDLRVRKIQPQFVRLWLSTQAGTYVKEFVHGDFGRTRPSLGELLQCEADILTLDVEAINTDWPPCVD